MRHPFVFKVATSNHLLEGDVIYFTGKSWSRELAMAMVARSLQEAEVLLAQASNYPDQTVGIELIDVKLSSGIPTPIHFREVFRTKGPSNYFHGKQEKNV